MHCVKIGLYARVSSEKQAQERTIESQVAAILALLSWLKKKRPIFGGLQPQAPRAGLKFF